MTIARPGWREDVARASTVSSPGSGLPSQCPAARPTTVKATIAKSVPSPISEIISRPATMTRGIMETSSNPPAIMASNPGGTPVQQDSQPKREKDGQGYNFGYRHGTDVHVPGKSQTQNFNAYRDKDDGEYAHCNQQSVDVRGTASRL